MIAMNYGGDLNFGWGTNVRENSLKHIVFKSKIYQMGEDFPTG